MVEKIKAEIEKLENEKNLLVNDAESEKYIAEKVAEYENGLRAELNEKKEKDVQAIDYKLAVLKDWLEDELNKPVEEVVEEVIEEPVVEETVVEQVEEQPKAPIVY